MEVNTVVTGSSFDVTPVCIDQTYRRRYNLCLLEKLRGKGPRNIFLARWSERKQPGPPADHHNHLESDVINRLSNTV